MIDQLIFLFDGDELYNILILPKCVEIVSGRFGLTYLGYRLVDVFEEFSEEISWT